MLLFDDTIDGIVYTEETILLKGKILLDIENILLET